MLRGAKTPGCAKPCRVTVQFATNRSETQPEVEFESRILRSPRAAESDRFVAPNSLVTEGADWFDPGGAICGHDRG